MANGLPNSGKFKTWLMTSEKKKWTTKKKKKKKRE